MVSVPKTPSYSVASRVAELRSASCWSSEMSSRL